MVTLPAGPAGRKLVLEACVGEAARRTSLEVQRLGLDVRDVPGLSDTSDPIADLRHGRRRVPLTRAAARMMKERFPALARGPDPSETVRFWAPFAPGRNLFVDLFKDASFGLGNGFSPRIGVHLEAPEPLESGLGLFELLGRKRPPSWRYTSAEELEAALAAAGDLLDRLLPPFRDACAALLARWPAPLPADIECCGAIGSRQAFERAVPMANAWAPDARFDQLMSASDPYLHDPFGPTIGADGLLAPHARWTVRFTSSSLRQHFWAMVPAVGPVRAGAGPVFAHGSDPLLPTDFVDSSAAVAAAERAAADELRNGLPVFERFVHMPPEGPDPGRIGVRYILTDRALRRDVLVRLRARDGGDPLLEVR